MLQQLPRKRGAAGLCQEPLCERFWTEKRELNAADYVSGGLLFFPHHPVRFKTFIGNTLSGVWRVAAKEFRNRPAVSDEVSDVFAPRCGFGSQKEEHGAAKTPKESTEESPEEVRRDPWNVLPTQSPN